LIKTIGFLGSKYPSLNNNPHYSPEYSSLWLKKSSGNKFNYGINTDRFE
jgi:hypothetical protein